MTQSGCSDKVGAETVPDMIASTDSTPDTTPFTVWTQTAQNGLSARWIGHGAHLISVTAPDGTPLLASLPTPDAYADDHPFLGSLIGPVANRIEGGRFELNGVTYDVPATENGHTLHSGPDGFDTQDWDVMEDRDALVLRYSSVAGEQNYPGNLDVTVRSTLSDRELRVEFTAITDAPTPVNLTQHGYWNPSGLFTSTIDTLTLHSPADRFVAVDAEAIPTGETPSVEGTAYDFREAREIGANATDVTLLVPGQGLREIASLSDGVRTLTILSDYPGFQIFTGETLSDVPSLIARGALALEPQYPPNAVNRPIDGHDTILRPGEVYRQTILYRFDGPGFSDALEPVSLSEQEDAPQP